MGKKETKLSLLIDDMIIYIQNPKEFSITNLLNERVQHICITQDQHTKKNHLNFYILATYMWKLKLKTQKWGQAWWLTPVIPALWEAKAVGSRGQEIETILVNMVKPRLY